MSVKKDPSGRRWVQVEVEVPGTPEEVWEAIATGPGVSSWFVPTEVREDGTVVSRFGPGMEVSAKRTAWDPPRRFAAESQGFPPGAPPLATEWTVEARAGGKCIVRVVHSLFASTDEWDNQLEGTESGWPWFFRVLRMYLTHFRGQKCAAIRLMSFVPGSTSEVWERFTGFLGFSGGAIGVRCRTGAGTPPLGGVIEQTGEGQHKHAFLLRLDEPAPGIASIFVLSMGGQACVVIDCYLYGDTAAAKVARDEPLWQAWMSEKFPPAAAAQSTTPG